MRRLLSDHQLAGRLRGLEDALAEAWLHEEGLARVAHATSQLLPGTVGCFYFRDPDGSFGPIGHTARGTPSSTYRDWPGVPNLTERLAPIVGYRLRGRDPFANRVANLTTCLPNREHRRIFQEMVLGPAGLAHQLRAVLYRGHAMRAWFGVFGPRGDRDFSTAETRVLRRALPAVRDTLRAGDATRYGRAEPTAVQGILEALDQPVWILARRGSVAHANAAARSLGADARSAAARAAAATPTSDPRFAVSRVTISGEPLSVVIGRQIVAGPSLPPSLERVASLIAAGASDKDIAVALDAPLATVRTYVRRIYVRLGVRNRAQLARRWLGRGVSS